MGATDTRLAESRNDGRASLDVLPDTKAAASVAAGGEAVLARLIEESIGSAGSQGQAGPPRSSLQDPGCRMAENSIPRCQHFKPSPFPSRTVDSSSNLESQDFASSVAELASDCASQSLATHLPSCSTRSGPVSLCLFIARTIQLRTPIPICSIGPESRRLSFRSSLRAPLIFSAQ